MAKLRRIVRRGILRQSSANRDEVMEGYLGSASADEPEALDRVIRAQHYGFRSRPAGGPGTRIWCIAPEAGVSQRAYVASEVAGLGPEDQQEWEVELYGAGGQRVRLDEGGNVLVQLETPTVADLAALAAIPPPPGARPFQYVTALQKGYAWRSYSAAPPAPPLIVKPDGRPETDAEGDPITGRWHQLPGEVATVTLQAHGATLKIAADGSVTIDSAAGELVNIQGGVNGIARVQDDVNPKGPMLTWMNAVNTALGILQAAAGAPAVPLIAAPGPAPSPLGFIATGSTKAKCG